VTVGALKHQTKEWVTRRLHRRRRWLGRLLGWLDRRRRWSIWALGLGLVSLFAAGDYLIRRQLELSILYVVPVALVTYYVGRRQGWLVSGLAAVAWTWTNDAAGELTMPPAVLAFNGTVRLAMFGVVVLLMDALRHAFEQERELARTDGLTGTANYRAFAERAELELSRTRRHRHPLTLIHLDLDGFKAVNDRQGHDVGDELLLAVAQAIGGILRRTDLVARLGGDEFALLLPETDPSGARSAAEKIRATLLEAMRSRNWAVTGSFGVLTCLDAPPSVEEFLRRADALMYRSKGEGKNRISYDVVAAQLVSVT
jgi:diguanylate cyclase (GGDEF)-like protein